MELLDIEKCSKSLEFRVDGAEQLSATMMLQERITYFNRAHHILL
jgi:hypothetical protein